MQKGNFFIVLLLVFLNGCASSDLSRHAATQVDTAYSNIANTSLTANSPVDAYQNSSQIGRGAIVGGVAGALVGVVSSGVGIVPGAAGGAVAGGIIGAYVEHQVNLVDQLENRGVKIIILGDQVMLVLSSDRIFKSFSPTIKGQAFSTLDLVAQLIRGYTSMLVKVSAFTNNSMPCEISRALTQQQAESIVKYLWSRVNTRVLTAMGYGGTHLVESNQLDLGDNYRIEITLEKLPT